jgi:hypothetical protein
MAKAATAKPVLVTTEFRGVFFGYLKNGVRAPAEITLTGARNCIYWSADCGGFLGLAAKGPNGQCKIGARVPEITLYKVTSVTPVEPGAAKAWDAA